MNILLFGITREIIGSDKLVIPEDAGVKDVAGLRAWLAKSYPQFGGLRSLVIAVDKEYADDNQTLNENVEIALIPPVSGG